MTIEQLKNEIADLEQQQNQCPDLNFTERIISLKKELKKMEKNEEIDAQEKQNSKVRRNR